MELIGTKLVHSTDRAFRVEVRIWMVLLSQSGSVLDTKGLILKLQRCEIALTIESNSLMALRISDRAIKGSLLECDR